MTISQVAPVTEDQRPAAMAAVSNDNHRIKKSSKSSSIEYQRIGEECGICRTDQSKSAFPFLGLPAEIRNMIYCYALNAPRRSKTKQSYRTYRKRRHRRASLYCPIGANVSLVRTCHQIYHETKGMLFELNTFLLSSFLLPDVRNAIRSWPIWRSVKSVDLISYCITPKHLHSLVRAMLEQPTMRIRTVDIGLYGLAGAADFAALRNLKLETSITLTVYIHSSCPFTIGAVQTELDLIVPKMMGKFCLESRLCAILADPTFRI